MTPSLARKVLTSLSFDVMKVLLDYSEERLKLLRATTEQSPDLPKILHAQGGITELKRLLEIREHAEAVLLEERGR